MNIILSSIKRSIRDKENIITVIFLAVMLPAIFSTMFSFGSKVEEVSIGIYSKNTTEISNQYKDFLREFDKNTESIIIKSIKDISENTDIKKEDIDVLIKIDEEGKLINFQSENALNTGVKMIRSINEEFFIQISTYETIAQGSQNLQTINPNIIKNINLEKEQSEITKDMDYSVYFSLVMLEMVTLVGSMYTLKNIIYLKENKGKRVLMSPINISKILTLELAGSFITTVLQGVVVLFITSLIYGVNVNINNVFGIMAIIGALSLFSVSMGILVTTLAKSKQMGDHIVTIMTVAITISSGQITADLNPEYIKGIFFDINPIKWINQSLFALSQSNSYENMHIALGITLAYTIIMMIISVIILKRKVVK